MTATMIEKPQAPKAARQAVMLRRAKYEERASHRAAIANSKCRMVCVPADGTPIEFDELVDKHIRSYEAADMTPPSRDDLEAGIFTLLAAGVLEYAK